jgi:oligoendopeptidase F
LISIGLLELAKTDEGFNEKFKGFLSETGVLPLEQLIQKHFHLDLSQADFWQQSVKRLIQDIEHYKQIVKYCT